MALYSILMIASSILIHFFLIVISKNFINFLPSISWLVLIIMPFFLMRTYFVEDSLNAQLTGISVIYIALIISDRLTKIEHKHSVENTQVIQYNKLYYFLFLSLLLFPVFHYFSVGNLPLIEYLGGSSKMEFATSRLEFNKLDWPYPLAIFSNWLVNLIAPITLFLGWKLGKKSSIFLILWISFYAISSGAQAQILMLFASLVLIWVLTKKSSIRLIFTWATLILICFTILCGVLTSTFYTQNLDKCEKPSSIVSSPTNISRFCSDQVSEQLNFLIRRIGYRVFLTPIEVSNHWYEYYLDKSNTRPLNSLVRKTAIAEVPNEIGRKYYFEVFPGKYLESVTAYASIDADAYSFGRLFGIVLVGGMLILVRFAAMKTFVGLGQIGQVFQAISLSLLSLLPFSASIQALLFSQGYLMLIFIAFCLLTATKMTKLKMGG